MTSSKIAQKMKSLLAVTSCSSALFAGVLYYKNDEKFFDNFAMPTLRFFLSPEKAYKLGLFVCKWNLIPRNNYIDPPNLSTTICGIQLKNPVGLAAGFDRNAEALLSLHKLGFGFVEIGPLMPEEQEALVSHPPKMFLLTEDEAIISRNTDEESKGHANVVPMLRSLRHRYDYEEIFGMNLGVNRNSEFVKDSVMGVKMCSKNANYLVININPSSNLEQQKQTLRELIPQIHKVRQLFDEDAQRPIFFKLSSDLNPTELREIVSLTREKKCKVHGFIIANSTHEHDNLKSKHAKEEGALSGVPLRAKSTKMIEDVFKLTKGDTVIIGCGGINSGKDAYEKILAGASAVQIYTSFIYHGPPVVEKIKRELSELLIKNGYANVSEAVGKGVMIEGRKGRWLKWIPFL